MLGTATSTRDAKHADRDGCVGVWHDAAVTAAASGILTMLIVEDVFWRLFATSNPMQVSSTGNPCLISQQWTRCFWVVFEIVGRFRSTTQPGKPLEGQGSGDVERAVRYQSASLRAAACARHVSSSVILTLFVSFFHCRVRIVSPREAAAGGAGLTGLKLKPPSLILPGGVGGAAGNLGRGQGAGLVRRLLVVHAASSRWCRTAFPTQ